ncbi:MAG: hypothetical protein R3C68_07430 [Myxococcota bacterium]
MLFVPGGPTSRSQNNRRFARQAQAITRAANIDGLAEGVRLGGDQNRSSMKFHGAVVCDNHC